MCFTGMKYVSSSVDFDDGSGSPTWGSYDPWKNNYPTSLSGDECVTLMYNHATWEWKLGNKDCNDSYGFICEITQGKCVLLVISQNVFEEKIELAVTNCLPTKRTHSKIAKTS